MQKDVLLASMLICMATSSAAWAGNNVEKSKADSLHTYQLQTVVVASTRAGNKTPMAFQNVSRKELQSVNFGKDIPYLLSLTPSVITTSDAGNGIGYTTLRVRGTDPTRINITVNGVPQNDAESSGLYWRCGHFDQWCRCFRCHRQHAHREYRHHALYGSRPQRRLLLQSQRDIPLQHGTLGWPLGRPGTSEQYRFQRLHTSCID